MLFLFFLSISRSLARSSFRYQTAAIGSLFAPAISRRSPSRSPSLAVGRQDSDALYETRRRRGRGKGPEASKCGAEGFEKAISRLDSLETFKPALPTLSKKRRQKRTKRAFSLTTKFFFREKKNSFSLSQAADAPPFAGARRRRRRRGRGRDRRRGNDLLFFWAPLVGEEASDRRRRPKEGR